MGINALGSNYGVYGTNGAYSTNATATVNEDVSILTQEKKDNKSTIALAVGAIGATAATIYAFKTGKANGNTGFKAITEGFKKIGGRIADFVKKLFKKGGNKETSGLEKAAKAIEDFKVPQDYDKLVSNYVDEVKKIGDEAMQKVLSTPSWKTDYSKYFA